MTVRVEFDLLKFVGRKDRWTTKSLSFYYREKELNPRYLRFVFEALVEGGFMRAEKRHGRYAYIFKDGKRDEFCKRLEAIEGDESGA